MKTVDTVTIHGSEFNNYCHSSEISNVLLSHSFNTTYVGENYRIGDLSSTVTEFSASSNEIFPSLCLVVKNSYFTNDLSCFFGFTVPLPGLRR